MKITLTEVEIEALHAAVGNIDPCMFDEMGKEGERLAAAWETGRQKLGNAVAIINARKLKAGWAAAELKFSRGGG